MPQSDLDHLFEDGQMPDEMRQFLYNPFQENSLPSDLSFPLPDEPHVKDWRRYQFDTRKRSVLNVLQDKIGQLNFPIEEGISQTESYANVSRRGESYSDQDQVERLQLEAPETLQLEIYSHPAGALPVLITPDRDDFEKLYRALGYRSEPGEVPYSVNAQMVSGLNNWDRVHRYKQQWQNDNPQDAFGRKWSDEFTRVAKEEPEQFKDRVILVHKAPYSGQSASKLDLDLPEKAWEEKSLAIRIEHEFTHYFTKRVFGTMQKHPWDELIADFRGLLVGFGQFDSQLFQALIGIHKTPYPSDGRIHTYLDDLPPALYGTLATILRRAADHLESIAQDHPRRANSPRFLLALCLTGLGNLALTSAEKTIARHL